MMLSPPRLAFSNSLPSLCHVVCVDRRVVSVLMSKAILILFELIWKTTYFIKRNDQTILCASSNISCVNVCWHVLPKKIESQLEFKDWVTHKSERPVFYYAHSENIQSGSYSQCDWAAAWMIRSIVVCSKVVWSTWLPSPGLRGDTFQPPSRLGILRLLLLGLLKPPWWQGLYQR